MKSAPLAVLLVMGALASPVVCGQQQELQGPVLMQAHCSGCHSLDLVSSQRGDARFWRATIRWMQRTQNLWAIPAADEQVLITYLAETFAESDWGRRPNLSPQLQRAVDPQ